MFVSRTPQRQHISVLRQARRLQRYASNVELLAPPCVRRYRRPVVDGQRYQVHAHLEFPGGHFESEPYVFTATTGTTIVTLRPDSPRTLHP